MVKRLDGQAVIIHIAHTKEQDPDHDAAQQRGQQTLALFSQAMQQAGVQSQALMLFSDDIVKAILNTANDHQCTMIVLGLSGKNALQKFMSRDVPVELLKQTQIPVLLCPATWHSSI